jgi:hypothetical protein
MGSCRRKFLTASWVVPDAVRRVRYVAKHYGVSGRLGTCTNCDENGETFRSDLSS